jgi:uncharacterized membrane protein
LHGYIAWRKHVEICNAQAREREAMAQNVHESIEVQAPLQDVFTYWSNLEHFPAIMSNVEECA